jgi:hypothetical protein
MKGAKKEVIHMFIKHQGVAFIQTCAIISKIKLL